jgi:hypothetical protein
MMIYFVLSLACLGSITSALPVQEGHKSALHISAHGDMMRRQAEALVEMSREDPLEDVHSDGVVTVVAPAESSSEQTKLEELTEECMQEEPTSECMEKFGSYGIKKLFTETSINIKSLGYERPGWMSHPEVQKRRLFEVTFPGTAHSGTYSIMGQDALQASATPFGLVSQNLDFYDQLMLGMRAFDLKVAYSTEAKLIYISHGSLMMPLATALRDIKRFLEEHEREFLVLDIRKDPTADITHLQPLIDEDSSSTRVPGQLVHEAVQCELKQMLTTYSVLTQLPASESAENPTIGALTDIGAHVLYMYDSQQVLCTSWEECQTTPGHSANTGGHPFAFGPPFELGTRGEMTGGRSTARMIEPACMVHSSFYTENDQPEKLMKKIKEFAVAQPAKTQESRPACFPAGATLPVEHSPTILYTIDGYVTPTPEEQSTQTERMRGVKAIYTRGEGYTARTDSERTNYLLLSWFLKKNNQAVYTKPNMILFEFAGSAAMPTIRVIEAMQMRPECGFALYCKASGSCWADTLLGDEDKCIPEKEVMTKLEEHANGKPDTTAWVITATICIASVLGFCGLLWCMRKTAILFKSSRKKKEEPLVDAQETSGEDGGDQPTDEGDNEAKDQTTTEADPRAP